MTVTCNLLLVGKVRPERKVRISGMATAVQMPLVAIEDPAEAIAWLENNVPGCVVVEATAGRIDKVIGKVRGGTDRHVPVFALAQAPDDLFIEQYFAWGGDDIVPDDAGATLLQRLKSIPRGPLKPCPGRCVLLVEPETARRDVLARVFLQGGFDVQVATDRASLEAMAKRFAPQVIVVNGILGDLTDLVQKTRLLRNKPGWIVLSARRNIESTQETLSLFERCAVLGVQSNPWQILCRANEVARLEAVERRGEVRRPFSATVLFRAAGGDDDDVGIAFNLSTRGAFVRTFAPLDADRVWLEWRVPQEKTRVRLEGRVAWRQSSLESNTRSPTPLGFGIEFVDALGASHACLLRLVESLQHGSMRALTVPPALRASVRPGADAVIEPPTLPKSERPPAGAGPGKLSLGGTNRIIRTVANPPRPTGSAVVTASQPLKKSAEVAQQPVVAQSPDGDSTSEVDDWDVTIEPTTVDQSPVVQAEETADLPAFSHPDILPSFGIDEAPTAASKRRDVVVSAEVSPMQQDVDAPEKRVAVVHGGSQAVSHESEDIDQLVPKSTRGRAGLWWLLGGLLAVAAGIAAAKYHGPGRGTRVSGAQRAAALAQSVESKQVLPVRTPSESTDASATEQAVPSAQPSAGVSDASVASSGEPLVRIDTGEALPGFPPVAETQADQGRTLSERYGYLVVRFPEPAFIYSDNAAIGPVNSKIATTCGEKTLRVGVGDKPPFYLSDPGKVTVTCRSTTRVVFRRTPGLVVPPDVMRVPVSGPVPRKPIAKAPPPEGETQVAPESPGETTREVDEPSP